MPEIVMFVVAAIVGLAFIHVIRRVAWMALKIGVVLLAAGSMTIVPGVSKWLEKPVAQLGSKAPSLPSFGVAPRVPSVDPDLGVQIGSIVVNQFTAGVFGVHLVAGIAVMALTYAVMERWYAGSIVVTPALIGSVAFADSWMLGRHVQPWLYGVTVEQAAFAAATGFAAGLLLMTIVFEPEFQSRTTGGRDASNSANDAFQRLNL
jgi:hypothetical protein